MQLRRFDDAAAFRERALPFLVTHEAHHNLLLGISAGLVEQPDHDAQAPYLATVEADGHVLMAAVMTPPRRLLLSLATQTAALVPLVQGVYQRYPTCPGALGPTPTCRLFAERWQQQTGQLVRPGIAQRIYQLTAVTPVTGVPGALRPARMADRSLLIEWITAFGLEALGETDRQRAAQQATHSVDARLASATGGIFLWWDEQPVSLVGFGGPTPNGIRVGPVYTPPAHRRRGYASAAVAATSQHLLDQGYRYCFLFTDLSNPTSNHIYHAIGYQPVCDVDEYVFSSQ